MFKLLTGLRAVNQVTMDKILENYEFTGGADDFLGAIGQIGKCESADGVSSFHLDASAYSASSFRIESSLTTKPLSKAEMKSLREPQPSEVNFEGISDESVIGFIGALLDVNFVTRLGSGEVGTSNVQRHSVFKTIDWDKLERKEIEPTYIPRYAPTIGERVGNAANSARNLFNGLLKTEDDGQKAGLGAKWSSTMRMMSNSKQKITSPEGAFGLNFESLLQSIGKEEWIPEPLRVVATSVGLRDDFYSMSMTAETFGDWNYVSEDAILDEVGLCME